jgi:hypothetical protein
MLCRKHHASRAGLRESRTKLRVKKERQARMARQEQEANHDQERHTDAEPRDDNPAAGTVLTQDMHGESVKVEEKNAITEPKNDAEDTVLQEPSDDPNKDQAPVKAAPKRRGRPPKKKNVQPDPAEADQPSVLVSESAE